MPGINIFAGMTRSYTIGISVVFNENWNNTLDMNVFCQLAAGGS
jgi:hypothetical protein